MVSILNADLPFKTQPLTFIYFKQKKVDKKEYMCYSLKEYRGNICLNFSTIITIIIQTHII